jgi:hypothetical protein
VFSSIYLNEPRSKDWHSDRFSPTELFGSGMNCVYFDLSLNTTSAFQIGVKQICLPGSSKVIKRSAPQTCFLQFIFSKRVIFYFSSSSLRGYRNFFFLSEICLEALKCSTDLFPSLCHMKCTTYGNEALTARVCINIWKHTCASEANPLMPSNLRDERIRVTIFWAQYLLQGT